MEINLFSHLFISENRVAPYLHTENVELYVVSPRYWLVYVMHGDKVHTNVLVFHFGISINRKWIFYALRFAKVLNWLNGV
jgi:hypothetical protein